MLQRKRNIDNRFRSCSNAHSNFLTNAFALPYAFGTSFIVPSAPFAECCHSSDHCNSLPGMTVSSIVDLHHPPSSPITKKEREERERLWYGWNHRHLTRLQIMSVIGMYSALCLSVVARETVRDS